MNDYGDNDTWCGPDPELNAPSFHGQPAMKQTIIGKTNCDHYFVTRTDRIKRFCHKCNLNEDDRLVELQKENEELKMRLDILGANKPHNCAGDYVDQDKQDSWYCATCGNVYPINGEEE
jgi:hypothetical protein